MCFMCGKMNTNLQFKLVFSVHGYLSYAGKESFDEFWAQKSFKEVDIKKYCLNIRRSQVPIKKKLPFPRIENFSKLFIFCQKFEEISKKQPEESF